MDIITHNVRDIDRHDRQALEHLVGRPLHENQQIIINVVTVNQVTIETKPAVTNFALPDWCNVYEGLSDAEVDELDKATQHSLDLTRPGE